MKTEWNHWLLVCLCLGLAALIFLCGWLAPAHIQAIDLAVLQRAGERGATLVDRGLTLRRAGNPDAARLLSEAAEKEKLPRASELVSALAGDPQTEPLFPGGPTVSPTNPATAVVIRLENRERLLAYLEADNSSEIKELLRTRALTNTVLLPPSSSASGQAFDAAVSICGLLLTQNHLAPGLSQTLAERAHAALAQGDSQPLEEILMDLMSLGQRLDFGQLAAFMANINSPATLNLLTAQARNAGAQFPEFYSAVILSDKPDQVAAYLNDFSKTGLNDLSISLRHGKSAVDELLRRHQPVYESSWQQSLARSTPGALYLRAAADYSLRVAWFALMVKWLFYILSGFLLAVAFYISRVVAVSHNRPGRLPPFHFVRNLLFALGFLLVVLLLSEPFLARENQKAPFAFRLRLPGAAAANVTPAAKSKTMQDADPKNLLTLLLFFVLQALIYSICLAKLSEIRRQPVPPRVQLKLLENEEHLFDAGLYLGFAGTIVCLILISMKFIQQQSLMAAYSSTSFGIIFVSVFKIFNLRPVRRRLLMQAEAQSQIADKNPPLTPATAPAA